MNIYICGIIGYTEAERLLAKNRELCESRLPAFFLRQFESLKSEQETLGSLCEMIASGTGNTDGSITVVKLGEGGIYRGLWELGVQLHCGIEADVLRIPAAQEVIEIMELTSADPYEADSENCFLIAAKTDNPEDTLTFTELLPEVTGSVTNPQKDVYMTYIGHTIPGKVRTIKMPEGVRFLTPPGRQLRDMAAKRADRR